MSSRPPKHPTAAFCEDVDEGGRTLPETRISANANVAVKRSSKPDLDVAQAADGSIATDSGYSSRAATIASAASDPKNGTEKPRRVALRLDTSMRPSESKERHEARPQHVRHGSSSHGTSNHNWESVRRQSDARHLPGLCRDCDELYAQEEMERLTRRFPREARIPPASEARPVATPQQTSRPGARRSSSSSRPASVDLTNLTRSLPHERDRGMPPSAWPNLPSPAYPYPHHPPSPQYTLPPTPIQYVSPIPYTPNLVPVFSEPRPVQPPLQRRQTIYGPPLVRQDSHGHVYSATPTRDDSLSDYQYVTTPYESTSRRHHEDEARRAMPPPARPKLGRSNSSSTSIHQVERPRRGTLDSHSRRPSNVEPPSATTIRPPNRKSVSYDVDTRRPPVDYPIPRRPVFEGHGHDLGVGLEAQLHYAEDYQRVTDVHPREPLTTETVKKPRPPSNAGSHQSRSSRGSGHKSGSSSSHRTGGFTIMKGGLTLDVNNTKHHRYSISALEKGISVTVDETSSRTGSSTSAEKRSREERHGRTSSSREIAASNCPGEYPSRSRHSFWARQDGLSR